MTMNLTPDAAIGVVTPVLRSLGLALPKAMTKALSDLDEATRQARDTMHSAPGAAATQIAAALIEGRDPIEDPELQANLLRALACQMMAQGDPIATARANRRSAIVKEYTPALLDLMAGVIESADAHLAEAHTLMPDVDFHDPNSVTGLQASHMTPWAHAREALDAVDRIAGAWATLCGSTGLADVAIHQRALIVADLTWDELRALGGRGEAWRAGNAGHRLALASPDEFTARVQSVDDERAEANRLEQEEHEHFKRTGMTKATARLVRLGR